MEVQFKKSFIKDIGALKDSAVRKKLKGVIESAKAASTLADIANLKKRKGKGSYYRVRLGEYRVGLIFDEGRLTFVRVLHRKEIYRYFP